MLLRVTLRVWKEKKLNTTKRMLVNLNRPFESIEKKIRKMMDFDDETMTFTLEQTIYAGKSPASHVETVLAHVKQAQETFLSEKGDVEEQSEENDY